MTPSVTWRERLSTVPAGDILGQLRKVFTESKTTAGTRQALHFPFPAAERLAVLSDQFLLPKNARHFDPGDKQALVDFQPQGIIANAAELLLLGEVPIEFGIVVLSPIDEGGLTPGTRNLLWKRFGVPVFEYLQAADGRVIAMECEAHAGLHVLPEVADFELQGHELFLRTAKDHAPASTGLTCEIITAHCECELETKRLSNLAILQRAKATAA